MKAAREASGPERPVHLWNPEHCGVIDIRIASDGTWFHEGSPIGRLPLVKLFASVLRRDPEGFVLVTPAEKLTITVEDAPFLAVEMRIETGKSGQVVAFRTNLDDWVIAGPDHPLRFERDAADGVKPYVLVRGDLWALVTRAIFYDLVERGETRDIEGRAMFGVASAGAFFPMAPAQEIENLV